jgi:hypothetical protein
MSGAVLVEEILSKLQALTCSSELGRNLLLEHILRPSLLVNRSVLTWELILRKYFLI